MTKAQLQGKSSTDEKDSSAGKIEKPVERSQESPLLPPHLLIKAPPIVTPSNIQALQRAVGNRAVQRVLAQRDPGRTALSDASDSGVVQRHTGATADGLAQTGQSQLDHAINEMTNVSILSKTASTHTLTAQGAFSRSHAAAEAEPVPQGEQEEIVVPATGGI